MKKTIYLPLLVFMCAHFYGYSQIVYEKGYFIDRNDQRTECLIKNKDWRSNPEKFNYKLSQEGEVKTADFNDVKAFGIYDYFKYKSVLVDVDQSSTDYNKLSFLKDPEFQKMQLFLKVLVEGEASLYQYVSGNRRRYYIEMNDDSITPLIYKKYLVNDNAARENNTFRKQLRQQLQCNELSADVFETIECKQEDLQPLFVTYNTSVNAPFKIYKKRKKKGDFFRLNLRPGINFCSMSIENARGDFRDTQFDQEVSLRFGIEAAFILPFNRNKWAIVLEPTYQYYNTEKIINSSLNPGSGLLMKATYKSIELPITIRYKAFLNTSSHIFIDASLVCDFAFDSQIESSTTDQSREYESLEISSSPNFAIGVGYKYKDKYGLECRYKTHRDVLSDMVYWNSEFNAVALIFSYRLF